jgi:Glycine-zipper domain
MIRKLKVASALAATAAAAAAIVPAPAHARPSIRERRLLAGAIATSITLALAGCATPRPTGPTLMALPGQGESFEAFQQHDITCRNYASVQSGGKAPGQAAAHNAVGGAAVGAGVGAAAGALIGSASGHAGNGAAIGAGSGLLAGTLLGSASGRHAAASVQRQYNMTYTQCMVANGDRISQPEARTRTVYRPAGPPAVIYAPAPVYVAPPPPP